MLNKNEVYYSMGGLPQYFNRDKEYESFHQNKKNIDGRRIKTSMSSRTYIN